MKDFVIFVHFVIASVFLTTKNENMNNHNFSSVYPRVMEELKHIAVIIGREARDTRWITRLPTCHIAHLSHRSIYININRKLHLAKTQLVVSDYLTFKPKLKLKIIINK